MDGKSSVQGTAKDLSSNIDTDAPEDGYADVDVGEHRPGYSESDRGDMYRMANAKNSW